MLKHLHAWGCLSAVFYLFALSFALISICETVCIECGNAKFENVNVEECVIFQ